MASKNASHQRKITLAGMMVALGVVYGDIGTSPLYVMKAIIEGNGGLAHISDAFIIGALSLVIWTLTLVTTIKYVLIALRADNHGEGGIFSLYTLVRKQAKWLVIPAMIGGAALLADGILTPAVTVTTSIEGLRSISFLSEALGNNQGTIIGITLTIITLLFLIQGFGTKALGRAFGPIMTAWFLFIAVVGLPHIFSNPTVFRAFNPLYGVQLLFSENNVAGVFILGSVFLATTGAEALYSDMGHVGRGNIYGSWPFVKISLLLNYFAQGAWLMQANDNTALYSIEQFNPFFEMLPDAIRIVAVVMSTLAAIIASQALITGSYTLVSEAINLDLLPHIKILYPSQTKGQMYIPLVNSMLWFFCMGVVLYFRTSARMEAAYGLAITITMLMTTILLFRYLKSKAIPIVFPVMMLLFFGALEGMFFISSATKFMHGGYVAVIIASLILSLMVIWYVGTQIEKQQDRKYIMTEFIGQLEQLKDDDHLPVFTNNLVYLTKKASKTYLDRDIAYSVLDGQAKRADVYCFIHITVTDEPYTHEYEVESFGTDYCFDVQLRLGFKVEQRLNIYMRQIVTELMVDGSIRPQQQDYSIYDDKTVGDFTFVMVRKSVSPESELTPIQRWVMSLKYRIKEITGSPARWYGLETAHTLYEYVPLFLKVRKADHLDRIITK